MAVEWYLRPLVTPRCTTASQASAHIRNFEIKLKKIFLIHFAACIHCCKLREVRGAWRDCERSTDTKIEQKRAVQQNWNLPSCEWTIWSIVAIEMNEKTCQTVRSTLICYSATPVVHSIHILIANKIHFARKYAEKLIISFSLSTMCVRSVSCVCLRSLRRCKFISTLWTERTVAARPWANIRYSFRSLCSLLCRDKTVRLAKWNSPIVLVLALMQSAFNDIVWHCKYGSGKHKNT